MAVNSAQIDLNTDAAAVLFDQHSNEVLGSNVSVGVSFDETLINDVGGTDGSLDMLSGSNVVVVIKGCGKESFCQGKVDGKVKNEDEKNVIQCFDGVSYVNGGGESDKGLVSGLNHGDAAHTNLGNEVQGVQDDHEVKNVDLANLSVGAGEDIMDVNVEESLDVKDSFLRRCNEVETSYEFKQQTFLSDAQVNATPNQTTDVGISGAGLSENTQNDCNGFGLVVDLNSHKNTQEEKVPGELAFSETIYHVSDLVWGKVRGLPWWPGRIYDPSIASEKAKKLQKANCYLIAYFGDETFGWNDVSMIKPFHKHFSEMEKQSDLEDFRFAVNCALEEASRQVESGLCCPCTPGDATSEVKTPVTANAVTSLEPTELVNFVRSLSQSPLTEFDRLDFVSARAQLSAFYRSKGYSQLPEFAVSDRLFANDMDILPVREKEQCEQDGQFNEQVLMKKTHQEFSQNSQHVSQNMKQTGKKKKLSSDVMSEEDSWTPNGERKAISRRGRKRKAAYDTSYDHFNNSQIADDKSTSRRGRKPKEAFNTSDDCFHNFQTAGDNSTSRRGRKRKLASNTFDDCFNNSQTGNITQMQNVSIDEMQSRLCLAAKDPVDDSCSNGMIHFFAEYKKFTGHKDSVFIEQGSLEQEHVGNITQMQNVSIDEMQSQLCLAAKDPADENCNNDMIHFFAEYKKFSGRNDSGFLDQGLSLEQEHVGNITQMQNVSIDEMQSQLCLAAKDPVDESCSNDMIRFFTEYKKFSGRNDSGFLEQGLSLEQKHVGETGVVTSIESAATASMSTPTQTPMELSNDSYWTDRLIQSISEEETLFKNQDKREELSSAAEVIPSVSLMHQDTNGNLGSEPLNLVEQVTENSPTSLTLKFTNLDSVPTTTELNKIFGRFGPLIESKTELLEKTNRARVVFERRCDAETAFSSAGKYSIFGPSLQSYRLKILPRTPTKVPGKRGRKSKKEKSSVSLMP